MKDKTTVRINTNHYETIKEMATKNDTSITNTLDEIIYKHLASSEVCVEEEEETHVNSILHYLNPLTYFR